MYVVWVEMLLLLLLTPGVGKLVVNFGFLPESVIPESMQDGSPTVIVGPKLLLPFSFLKHAPCFTSTLGRRLDSAAGVDGGATASTNHFTLWSARATGSTNFSLWLPSLLSSPSLVVHPLGTDPHSSRNRSAEFPGCRVGD